ncbi:MAG TPA: DUF1175 family protein [Blastocatellia bacterium]|nr:DUF1175 family protein [Blastocatellia bacterium]
MRRMNRQPNNLTTRIMRACAPFALAAIVGLAGFGCGKSPQARAGGEKTEAPPSTPSLSTAVWADSDVDGVPDAAELSSSDDRDSFRRWFAYIAEMQFYKLSGAWNADQRDCAGLVRFAWREALRGHDRVWFQSISDGVEGYEAVAPDVKAYDLKRSPLGEKLFRADFGSFRQSDLADDKFSEFADARTLKNHNATFISRDRRQARRGDLLFYHQPWVQKFPYHVMIFIGDARHDGEGGGDWVVYHTGSSPNDKGEVKKVRLAVLDHHPDRRWRPVVNNPNFLGFYRLKILE